MHRLGRHELEAHEPQAIPAERRVWCDLRFLAVVSDQPLKLFDRVLIIPVVTPVGMQRSELCHDLPALPDEVEAPVPLVLMELLQARRAISERLAPT